MSLRRFLASPRRRRRLVKAGAALLGVAALAFTMVNWSNTAKPKPEVFSNEPAMDMTKVPERAPFAKAKREGVLRTAAKFLQTAVVRENVAASWDLIDPTLKQGYTRKSWAREDIPVQPYPVDAARWKVDYSWRNVVGLKAALFPRKGREEVPAAVFDMELHAHGTGKSRRWLVSSWTPASYTGIPAGPLGSSRNTGSPFVEKQPLATHWLFAPFAVFGLALLVPLGLGVRGWWRGRRAVRRYEAGLR
ncbi:MAG: hypothetical protein M3540_06030 [Actinomycetota bacterium]|nr:hypothetical protein [Actinomycetota bacterium]